MKGKLTALVLPVLATKFAFAQLPIVNSTLNQVGEIQQSIQKKLVEPLPARLAKIEPFALSQLPSIAEVITEPLNALPSRLSIPALNNAVEVQLDDGWRAIERQWVMLADNQSIDILQQHGASLLSQQPYPALDVVLLRFTVPASLDSKAALTQILGDDQVATLDRNHVYASQTVDETANPQSSSGPTKFPPKKLPMCEDSLRIGMLDTAIQTDHPAFANTTIVTHSFVENNSQEPQLHGTAIAGLLVGQGHALSPLLPHAQVYAASVFYRQSDFAQGATMLHLVDGLNWLATQQVKVVNMSLSGPDNQILALVIKKLTEQGTVIVAAAGNEGPAAPAMYPAPPELIEVRNGFI